MNDRIKISNPINKINNVSLYHIRDIGLSDQEYNFISKLYSKFMRLIGIVLVIIFLLLYYLILRSFIYDNCFIFHRAYDNKYLTSIILIIGIVLGNQIYLFYIFFFLLLGNF